MTRNLLKWRAKIRSSNHGIASIPTGLPATLHPGAILGRGVLHLPFRVRCEQFLLLAKDCFYTYPPGLSGPQFCLHWRIRNPFVRLQPDMTDLTAFLGEWRLVSNDEKVFHCLRRYPNACVKPTCESSPFYSFPGILTHVSYSASANLNRSLKVESTPILKSRSVAAGSDR
jgi:hypothetical protein